ncbi:MAG: PQQ-dependent sugar dehydrogenase, partial [Flavobacteriales bacterium]|nr:PQQ-dependent sugar dehydrogenase [Flavobacteriales bacterium]
MKKVKPDLMLQRYLLLAVLPIVFFSIDARSQTTVTVGTTELEVREVITGIDIPWEIIWGPDGHIWFTERAGRISRLNPATGVRSILLNLTSSVYQQSESGMLGLALHPDFENTPQVFVAYTYLAGVNNVRERFVRYEYNGSALVNPVTLLENIAGTTTHNGARMLILPDNTILVSTGDAQQPSTYPQSLSSLNGKILRMNLDGSIPSDNPFGASSYIYSYGHRNAQGIVLAPNGKLYSSEHGPSTNDELNILVAGGNYGWPQVEGYCNLPAEQSACGGMTDYQNPITIWYEGSTIAPSDLMYYDHPAIPEFQGRLLMTVLKNKHLRAIRVDDVNGTQVLEDVEYLTDVFGRLRDICMAPDGRVFLATNGPVWSNTQPNTHKIVELKNANYDPVGVEGLHQQNFRVYPNPASQEVNISFDGAWDGGLLRVTDAFGRKVLSQTIQSNTQRLDVPALPSGPYAATAVGHGR